jgi:hypothetical protein
MNTHLIRGITVLVLLLVGWLTTTYFIAQKAKGIRDFLGYIETRVDEFDQRYVTKAKALWQTVA